MPELNFRPLDPAAIVAHGIEHGARYPGGPAGLWMVRFELVGPADTDDGEEPEGPAGLVPELLLLRIDADEANEILYSRTIAGDREEWREITSHYYNCKFTAAPVTLTGEPVAYPKVATIERPLAAPWSGKAEDAPLVIAAALEDLGLRTASYCVRHDIPAAGENILAEVRALDTRFLSMPAQLALVTAIDSWQWHWASLVDAVKTLSVLFPFKG